MYMCISLGVQGLFCSKFLLTYRILKQDSVAKQFPPHTLLQASLLGTLTEHRARSPSAARTRHTQSARNCAIRRQTDCRRRRPRMVGGSSAVPLAAALALRSSADEAGVHHAAAFCAHAMREARRAG